MKMFAKWTMGAMAGLFLLGATVRADDATSMKQELADLKAKLASMESAQASDCGSCNTCASCGGAGCLDCDAANMTSLKKKGCVQIGGVVKADVVVVNREDSTSESDEIDSTRVSTGEPYGAYLDFKVSANQDTYLFLRLDLDDAWDATIGQDDLIEEVYFAWDAIAGSNFSARFGKKPVNYGMDKFNGITPSFHDGWAYWMVGQEEVGSAANPHDTIGTNVLPTAPLEVFQAEVLYSWQEMATLSMTLFQNNDTTGNGRSTRGMHEDRSDDTGVQSYAAKLEITPIERLTLQASYVNQHTDSFGDQDLFGPDAEDDMSSLSVGFDYTFACLPLNIFGEYQHGFDWVYNDDASADVAQLGLIWGVTPCVDFGLMGEWARIEDAITNGDDEDYYQVVANLTYKFDNGIYMLVEYAHQWYDYDMSGPGDMERDADMIGFRTGWEF